MHLEIVFVAPDRLHSNSDTTTIAEVAHYIENKYHLCELFIKGEYKDSIKRILSSIAVGRSFSQVVRVESERLKNKWRDFINNRLHGLTTEASKREGRDPFINTQDYFLSMQVQIKATK